MKERGEDCTLKSVLLMHSKTSAGVLDYTATTESMRRVWREIRRKNKQLTPQREKYINQEYAYFWFNHLINQWFGSPHHVISTQTGRTIQPFESSLILSRALKKLCIQWSFSNPMKFTGTNRQRTPQGSHRCTGTRPPGLVRAFPLPKNILPSWSVDVSQLRKL